MTDRQASGRIRPAAPRERTMSMKGSAVTRWAAAALALAAVLAAGCGGKQAGGQRGAEQIAGVGFVVKSADGAVNAIPPIGSISITGIEPAVERIDGIQIQGNGPVDNQSGVGCRAISLAQWFLAVPDKAVRALTGMRTMSRFSHW